MRLVVGEPVVHGSSERSVPGVVDDVAPALDDAGKEPLPDRVPRRAAHEMVPKDAVVSKEDEVRRPPRIRSVLGRRRRHEGVEGHVALQVRVEVDTAARVQDGRADRVPLLERRPEQRPGFVKGAKLGPDEGVALRVVPDLDVPVPVERPQPRDPALRLRLLDGVATREGKLVVRPRVVEHARDGAAPGTSR